MFSQSCVCTYSKQTQRANISCVPTFNEPHRAQQRRYEKKEKWLCERNHFKKKIRCVWPGLHNPHCRCLCESICGRTSHEEEGENAENISRVFSNTTCLSFTKSSSVARRFAGGRLCWHVSVSHTTWCWSSKAPPSVKVWSHSATVSPVMLLSSSFWLLSSQDYTEFVLYLAIFHIFLIVHKCHEKD